MQLKSLNVTFFFLLFLMVGIAVFFVFQPFITAIVAAAILTALFKRPYHWFEHVLRGRRGLSAFLTCLLVILIIVTPLFLVLSLAISEANNLYHSVAQESTLQSSIDKTLSVVEKTPYVGTFFDTAAFDKERIIDDIKE